MSRMYPPSFYSSRFDYSMWSPSAAPTSAANGGSSSSSQQVSSSADYYQQQQPSTSSAGYYPMPVNSSRISNPYYSSNQYCNSPSPYAVSGISRSGQQQQPPGVPPGGSYAPSPYAQYAVQYYQHQHQMQQQQQQQQQNYSPQNSTPPSSQQSPYRQAPTTWKYPSGPPGQAPGAPPGYGPHPGDPNAAYYYGHQMDPSSMQARPHAWPPQSYPPGPTVGGAPPGYPPSMRPTAPMRAPLPQQMMQGPSLEEQQRYEEQQRQHYYQQQQQQQQQQAAYAAQQQQMSSSASLQVDPSSSQSRAPSAGPTAGSATPDSSSRLSAEDTIPHCPPSHSQTPVSAPSSGPAPPAAQPPPVGYYGQAQTPQMYGSPGLRPGVGPGTTGMPIKPTSTYPGAYSQAQPAGYPPIHGYPDGYQHAGMAQQQQQHQLYQQQMWASQQAAQRYPPSGAPGVASSSVTPPMSAAMSTRGSVGMPSSGDMSAAQQGYAQPRRPPYYHMQPQPPSAVSPSPGAASAQRLRYAAPPASSSSPLPQSQPPYASPQPSVPPQLQGAARPLPIGAPVGYPHMAPSTSTGIGGISHTNASAVQSTSSAGGVGSHHPQSSGMVMSAVSQYPPPQPLQFPAGSVEATTISQRRRRKLLSKDLIRADVRRLTMALRSGLETETTWALNALNALLYDDMAMPLNLNHSPALLNVIVEHFRAQLALLFPKIFKVGRESKVRTVDDEGDLWVGMMSKGEKTQMRQLVAPRSAAKNEPANFTKVSRTGRTVHMEKKELPDQLRRMRPDGWSLDAYDGTLSADYFECRVPRGMGCGTSTYLACRLVDNIDTKSKLKGAQFFLHEPDASASSSTKAEVSEVVDYDSIDKSTRVINSNKASAIEGESTNVELSVEMKTLRPTALCIRDEARMSIVKRCLSISNILRGFSFLPGNEGPMSRHAGLLYIVGRLLRLYADEQPITRPKALSFKLEFNKGEIATVPAIGTLSEATRRLLLPGELLESNDDDTLMLLETAAQLREDAFVIVSHLSVQMDLLDFDSDVSWPVFDGLIHWCVSKVAEAKDPLQPGYVSPRNYALETLCKMSVIERNVDLLISTGPWYRIERFIRVLADLLSINEEVPCREFAIVILNAVCAASEQACYVTAAESPAVNHLVAFLEMGDSNMHQVVQQHGMQALRDNPEMMGTSVGMLRRAASLMQHLCRVPACRKHFLKHQQRLLQFTMSQLMDSRVGAIIADVLYEVQKGISEEMEVRQPSSETLETNEDMKQEPTSDPGSALKEELESGDDDTSTKTPNEKSRKRSTSRDENGISEVGVSEENSNSNAEGINVEEKQEPRKKALSPPPIKKGRLENGTLNHVHKNGGDTGGTGTALVNGDMTPRSSPREIESLSPSPASVPSRKNTPSATAVPVENGTATAAATAASAGSVQAVA